MDSSDGQALLDESPASLSPQNSPLPPPRSSSRGLFFRSPDPQEEETPPLLPPQEAAEELDAAGSVSDPAPSPDEWGDPTGDPTSSPESSVPDRPAQLLGRKQMRDTAATAVKIGTGMAHTVAAKTDAQRAVGLYLADDDDAVAIGHPLADMLHRRGDIVGGKLSPDANDFLKSLMGVAGYFTKQVQKIGIVRQIEANAGGTDPQAFTPDAG